MNGTSNKASENSSKYKEIYMNKPYQNNDSTTKR